MTILVNATYRNMKETNQKEDIMSFFINNNPNRPGPIVGNPINGICEKALIEVTKYLMLA